MPVQPGQRRPGPASRSGRRPQRPSSGGREVGVEAGVDQLGGGRREARAHGRRRGQDGAHHHQRLGGRQVAVDAPGRSSRSGGWRRATRCRWPARRAAPSMICGSVNSRPIWPRPVTTMPGSQQLREPEVGEPAAVLGEQDVGGLDVAVGDAALVQRVGGQRRVPHGAYGVLGRERLGGALERAQRQVLHRVVERAAVPAGVVDLHQPVGVGHAEVLELAGSPAKGVVRTSARRSPSPRPRTRRYRADRVEWRGSWCRSWTHREGG